MVMARFGCRDRARTMGTTMLAMTMESGMRWGTLRLPLRRPLPGQREAAVGPFRPRPRQRSAGGGPPGCAARAGEARSERVGGHRGEGPHVAVPLVGAGDELHEPERPGETLRGADALPS